MYLEGQLAENLRNEEVTKNELEATRQNWLTAMVEKEAGNEQLKELTKRCSESCTQLNSVKEELEDTERQLHQLKVA